MAVQRRRLLVAPLLLLLLAGAAMHAQAATGGDGEAAPKASPPRPPRPPRSPKPPPRPPREAAQPQPEDNTPPPAERPQQPAPAPTPQPSPPPEPVAAPLQSPPPPPPVVPTTDLKLILEITGGPLLLTPEQQQSVVAVLSTYATPYSYTFRSQRPAAPGISPVPNSKTVVPNFVPLPSPPPAAPPPQPPKNGGGNGNNNGNGGNGNGGNGNGGNGNGDNGNGGNGNGGNGNKQQQQADGGGNRRRGLRRQLLRFGGAAAVRELQHASRGLLQSCPRDYQFEVAAEPECAAECQKKIAGKPDQFEFHEVFTTATGTVLCCSCRIKKGVQQPEGTDVPADTVTTSTTGEGSTTWWPTDVPVTPLNADGVYVFADCAVPLGGVETVKNNMLLVSKDGSLCKALASSGVSCDTTALRFHGTGEVLASAEGSADASATTSSSSGGLSTGAIIGIVLGGCAGLAALVIAIAVCVSCRRDRAINNAAKQRTISRRGDSAQEAESKWRQMYSARMQDSMRRTEEATARQQQASSGPSFLEMHDRQFSEQAMSPQRSFSSKKSFGRGTPEATLAQESPDHSLMTGSELSSPPPTDIKPSRSRSLKKLFSSSGKS